MSISPNYFTDEHIAYFLNEHIACFINENTAYREIDDKLLS